MRADARRNYERLLEAAREAFAGQGTDASLEEIAKTAGVGIGTLYRHFPTRQALLEAVLHEGITDMDQQGERLLGESPAEESLETWLRAVIRHNTRYRGLAAELMSSFDDESSQLFGSCDMMRATSAQLLARAQHAGAIESRVESADLLRMVNAIAWSAEQMPDDPGAADRMLALLLHGLRTR
jgi:AcrR family transcriptional regulator